MHKANEQQSSNRTKKFLKDPKSEEFLKGLNEILVEEETSSYQDIDESLPTIFIHGLPRSGTTLLMQFLINHFDLGYINNLAARFWLAPVQGCQLSKMLLDEHNSLDYVSSYGKTTALNGPHEFAFFWTHWLKMEDMPPYFPKAMEDKIDWSLMKKTLLNISATIGKPMIYKGILPGYFIGRFLDMLKQSLFIYIERDIKDVACSLYDARLAYYNDPSRWWSIYPDTYNEIKSLPYQIQIPRQVHDLDKQFKGYMDELPEAHKDRVIKIKLQDFCQDPSVLIDKIKSKTTALCSTSLVNKGQDIIPFNYNVYQKSNDSYSAISEGINKYLK